MDQTKQQRVEMIKPGNFGSYYSADHLRGQFDLSNEAILFHQVPVDAVFIGDSITQGWDLTTYFGRSGAFVVNRGIGGDITSIILKRFPADVIQLKPANVIIKAGINNTWSIDNPLISPIREELEQIRDGIVSDIGEMVSLANRNGIRTFVCTVLPTRSLSNRNVDVRNELVLEINERLKKLAAEAGAVYVDYHSRMTDPDGKTLREELADDGLHPHLLGYNIMGDTLRQVLNLDRNSI
jgi:lysophospholipase L1-like esterase